MCSFHILIHIYSFIYTFMCSFHILLNIYTFMCSFHILIHIYSFINSFKYTHSCILIHIFIHVYSFIITQSYIHSYIPIICYHFWLCVIIIMYHLTTLCVHDIFPFMFTIMFNSFSFSFCIIIFMFHEHIFTFFIFYIFLVSCLLHMALPILVKYDVYEITPHSYILIPL